MRGKSETHPVTTYSLQELGNDEECLGRRCSDVWSGCGESQNEEREVLQETGEALTAQSTRSYKS